MPLSLTDTEEQQMAKAERAFNEARDKYEQFKKNAKARAESNPEVFIQRNSRAQYNAEKAAGGPMTDLSYEQWKNLD